MLNIPSTNTDPSYRYKMPRLASKIEGRGNGIKTAVMNVKDVATAIHRPPGYVMKWFGCELGAKSSYEEKEGQGVIALVQGAHQTPVLQELLDKFLTVYVLCPTCGLPELDLKPKKKEELINGTCKACGFAGNMADATCHKMAAFVFKNPIGGAVEDADKGKKRSKEERRAAKNAKSQGGELEDEPVEKKKKKKDKKTGADSDGEGKEKKKKKEKKEKEKKGRSDSDDGNGSPAKEEDMTHKSEEILSMIQTLTELKSGPTAEFCEEARLLQISNQADRKMLMYAVLEAQFEGEKLSGKAFNANCEHFNGLVSKEKISVRDVMWGFELYCHEHPESVKAMPLICKSLYDADLLDEKNFLPYYNDKKANCDNPGHDAVHKGVGAFAEWLEEDNSGSDSDDSD